VVIIFLKLLRVQESTDFPVQSWMPISVCRNFRRQRTLMEQVQTFGESGFYKAGSPSLGFEFTMYGAILLVVGMVYMTIASFWLPKDSPSIESDYELSGIYVLNYHSCRIRICGQTYRGTLFGNPTLHIAKLVRNESITNAPGKFIKLKGLTRWYWSNTRLTGYDYNGNINYPKEKLKK
jgi:hypothetical protein